MTANKPMTGEQLHELMTAAVNMQRDAETDCNRPSAMFAYAVQVAVLELRKVRNDAAALAAEYAGLKSAHPQPFGPVMMKALDAYEKHQDETPETGMLDAFFILRDSIRVDTTATDSFMAEVRAQGVDSAINTLIAMMNHQHPVTSKAIDIMRVHAYQLRKGLQS
ncbi:hypothetical protein [Enterobacter bugandensis]|uniref:hypothetical protein n=1 Tax=Enterobacter bugandensis TaxID=881260 RepID=UPI001F3A6747|nr:hypothetical protein [Enterobacter bugandensis]